jgi:sulfate transport system permease protein
VSGVTLDDVDAPEASPTVPQARRSPWGSNRQQTVDRLLRGVFATYVGGLVALPLLALLVTGASAGPRGIWDAITEPTALDALWLSTWTAVVAAVVNGIMGTAIAWVLVRGRIPGRAAISALVDLPFAIPTLVAGILLVALYGPQTPIGSALDAWGFKIAFAKPGVILALLFVTLPFVVRAVEPILLELDPAEEEAAITLGATKFTTFVRVMLPPLLPAIASGTIQVFARSLAEFGSLAAVSGNLPHKTLTIPVYILGKVEGDETGTAAAVSLVLLVAAVALQPLAQALARYAGARRG